MGTEETKDLGYDGHGYGIPGWNRTNDLFFRKERLCPAELRGPELLYVVEEVAGIGVGLSVIRVTVTNTDLTFLTQKGTLTTHGETTMICYVVGVDGKVPLEMG